MFEKTVNDAEAALKALPDSSFAKTVDPWVDVTEHSAEHYGLLVAYYNIAPMVWSRRHRALKSEQMFCGDLQAVLVDSLLRP